jgi:serine protease AprX
MDMRVQEFRDGKAVFGRLGGLPGPFTLVQLQVAGEEVDIGRERQIVLRTVDDLNKLDSFWGLAGISAARLDLREQLSRLSNLTFDSGTVWPGRDKLPEGFNPGRLLEEGRNPGLGVRKLHEAAIDGKGVGIAIIDQPLLREHEQYKDRIVRYEAVEVDGVGPQMHGPAVASIAVGKDCGVAPGASLYYFAVPTWKWQQNEPWAALLEKIVKLNEQPNDTPKIRVVSISLGAFSERPDYARWKQAIQKAEDANTLVVTCDPDFLRIGTLRRIENRPELRAADYSRGWYFRPGAVLCVPAANRTLASFRGPRLYTCDRMGGMSWTVPYLAGVAALGWQVDPNIKPQEMVQLWRQTAAKTVVGAVIDPRALIEAINKRIGALL